MRIIVVVSFWLLCCDSVADTLVIAHAQGQFYPHEYTSQDNLQGLHVDIIEQAAKSLDLTVRFKSFPWKRAIKALEQGDVDGLSYIGKTPEREKFAHFEAGNVLSHARFFPIILRKNRNKIRYNGSVSSLRRYRIAVGTEFKYGEPFDSATYLNKVPIAVPEAKLLASLLRLNRIDVVIYDIGVLRAELSKDYVDQYFYGFKQSISENQYYVVFSKRQRSKIFAQRFAKAVLSYKSSELYRQKVKQLSVSERNNVAILPPES